MRSDFTKDDLNKTLFVQKDSIEKNRKWYKVDATWKTLWRLAVDIANKIIWKWKAEYCDFWDCWDYVIVENVDKLVFTWNNKAKNKIYYRYSWYKWNVKSINLWELMKKNPSKVLYFAVRWMLPKNKLRDNRMKRLKMFIWTSTKLDYFKPINLYND